MKGPAVVAVACLTIARGRVRAVAAEIAAVNYLFPEAGSTDFAGTPAASAVVCNFPKRSSEQKP
jgi:hypothetical protein